MRTLPTKELMRTSAVPLSLERGGLDRDTSKFLNNLLGLETVRQNSRGRAGSKHSTDSGSSAGLTCRGSQVSLPNTPCSSASTPSTTSPRPVALVSGPTASISFAMLSNWSEFNIFETACHVPQGALFVELFHAVDHGLDILGPLQLPMTSLVPALAAAQASYEEPYTGDPNMYHTALHGAEVLCSAVSMLAKVPRRCFGTRLPALSKLALALSALLHDLLHPGMQACFLEAVKHPVTFTYCDSSPLERMHLSAIFRLLHTHGCLQRLKLADFRRFRKLVSGMVLATDLSQGYNNTATIKAAFPTVFMEGGPKSRLERSRSASDLDGIVPANDVSSELLSLVVECADVSHPAKPLELHQSWSVLITHEFLRQGQLEEELGLPISPLCSRSGAMDSASFARSQQGFIDYVVRPKLGVLSKLCSKDTHWMEQLEENHAFWGSAENVSFQEVGSRVLAKSSTLEVALSRLHAEDMASSETN